VGLIAACFFGVVGIFGAAVSRQLTDEFKAWTPWLINHIIQRAVRQLPENQQERCEEEWRSHINEIPGEVGKLISAMDLLRASWKISRGLTDDTSYLVAKRAFDLACGALVFGLNLPLIIGCAISIWLFSGGPIFVASERRGRKNKIIRLLKFRTQHRFLRQMRLDLLPAVLNVLGGELSLVGPRPLKPGLVGWAMVNGFHEGAITFEKLKCEIEHDLYYIDNRSFLLDLKIFLLAVGVIFRTR